MPFISKSKYLAGLQCKKLLWFHYNAKAEIPPIDKATEAIFDQGHVVGALAKQLFPDGVEIDAPPTDFPLLFSSTREGLKSGKPVFEAALAHGGAFARADILNPAGRSGWEIVEVKSSTEVKEVNLHDLAFQKFTYEGAGLKIGKCSIMYINNKYVRDGEIEPDKLFLTEDITEKIEKLTDSVEENLSEMKDVIKLKKYPDIRIGKHCLDPYECPLISKCWSFLPEDNVLTLYRMRKERGFELVDGGITDIRKLPSDFTLSETQQKQVEAVTAGKPHVEREKIKDFLGQIEYPAFFLDFETFMTAVPLFDKVRPYQQIPFQYSLHIMGSPESTPEHYSYLSDGNSDPRPEILKKLSSLIGEKGSVVSYNASFEKRILKESSETYPEYLKWFTKIENRIVDLLQPFSSFAYYHPAQRGTASIKAVLPALTGKSYDGLEIAEGETASIEYLRVTFGENAGGSEKDKVYKQLEKYCRYDTQAMIDIINELRRLT